MAKGEAHWLAWGMPSPPFVTLTPCDSRTEGGEGGRGLMTHLAPAVSAGRLSTEARTVEFTWTRPRARVFSASAASHLLWKLFLTTGQFVWDLSRVEMWTNKTGCHGYGKSERCNVTFFFFGVVY